MLHENQKLRGAVGLTNKKWWQHPSPLMTTDPDGMTHSPSSIIIPEGDIKGGDSLRSREQHRFFYDCYRECMARLIEWGFKGDEEDTWFVTLTFKNECISEDRAFRLFESWLNRLKQHIIQNGGTAFPRYALAVERQIRGTIHFHMILHNPGLSSYSHRKWEEKWWKVAGFCRIGTYRRKAAPYLAKYTTKGSDVIFGGNWQGRTAPIRILCHPGNVGSIPIFRH